MNAQPPYRYERLSNENIHHLVTLFELVFQKKISLEFLQQKYNTHYLGISYLGYIAFDKDKPVAYGGFIPARVGYNGKQEVWVQSVDSMALKEVGGKGVFKQICILNEELIVAEHISCAYGFANQASAPFFFKNFNWFSNHNMQVYAIPLKGIPTSKILSKVGFGGLDEKRLQHILEDFKVHDRMQNPFNQVDFGHVVYDADLLNYKSGNRRFIIEIEGKKVWIKVDSRLSIGQMEDCGKEEYLGVIDKLMALGKRIGLNELFLQYSPHAMPAQLLNTRYNPIEGSPICFKPFAGTQIPLDKMLFSNADIDTF